MVKHSWGDILGGGLLAREVGPLYVSAIGSDSSGSPEAALKNPWMPDAIGWEAPNRSGDVPD